FYSPARRVAYPRADPTAARPFAYAKAIRLRGAHNLGNVQAAALAAERMGIAPKTIRAAVTSFTGVPHRLEEVRVLDGVIYINDSASTAPVAGVAALRSFTEPVVLIAGGNSKQLDFADFAAEAATRAKRVVLLRGTASDDFAAAVRTAAGARGRADPVVGPYGDLAAALREARGAAAPGDVVLFSPGFTSFGLFLNEFDRGNQFRDLVLEIERL
ncbi:MAG: UDP-N-acetylmuramoyl-L-alanine--D-glutamate ligase, partial [Ktedonobacterales bacterium]|nr:UDP-N-acetylmuramoyl-L-alanine--D-glutamate ligase [Ktedonobacterales bacterium]